MLHHAPSQRPSVARPGPKSRKYVSKLLDASHGGRSSQASRCGALDSIPETQQAHHVSPKKPLPFVTRRIPLEIKQHGHERPLCRLGKAKPARREYRGELRLTYGLTYAGVRTEVTYQILRHCFRQGEKMLGSIDFSVVLERGAVVTEITEESWVGLGQDLAALDAVVRVGFEVVRKGGVLGGLGRGVERCVKALKSKAHRRKAETDQENPFDKDGRKDHGDRLGRLQYFKLPY